MAYEEEVTEEKEGGISLWDIFRVIGRRIWWILGISVAVALIVGLVNKFVLNPGKAVYEITFMIEYPNSENRLLPDGAPFRYESIIYSENLNAVKDSDAKYKGINVDDMATNRNITITEATRTDQQTVSDLGIYTIRVKGKYFADTAQASEFLRAVCDKAVSDVCAIVEKSDYSANLVAYETNTTFADRITRLENQQTFLLAEYDKIMEQYGNIVVDGKAINAYYAELAVALSGDVRISVLRQELANERYLLNEKPEDILQTIKGLEREKERNEAQLTNLREEVERLYKLYGSSDSSQLINAFEVFHTRIAELVARNAVIDVETSELYHSIGYEKVGEQWQVPAGGAKPVDSSAFSADMKTLYDIMTVQTSACKNVMTSLYSEQSRVVLQQDNVAVSGGTSTILMAAVGFVGAFLVAAIVFYCIDRKKLNAKESVRKQEQSVPELKLEAAVTEEEKKDKE